MMETSTEEALAKARTLSKRYPHLRPIEDTWGSHECRALLLGLMLDKREGNRTGFPFEYGSLLLQLLQDHDSAYPRFDDSRFRHPIWSDDARWR